MYRLASIYRYIAQFLTLCGHFLYVECNGEEGKVHCYLVLAEVSEAFVSHIEFQLPENCFRFYRAVGAVHEPFLRSESLSGFSLVFHEPVIDFNLPVAMLSLVASPS